MIKNNKKTIKALMEMREKLYANTNEKILNLFEKAENKIKEDSKKHKYYSSSFYIADSFIENNFLYIVFYKKDKTITISMCDKESFVTLEGDSLKKLMGHNYCFGTRYETLEYQKNIEAYLKEPLYSFENKTKKQEKNKKYAKEIAEIDSYMEAVPKNLPKDFKELSQKNSFEFGYVFFDSKTKEAHCSECGSDFVLKKSRKHKEEGTCPYCKKRIVFLSRGKRSKHIEETRYASIIQKPTNPEKGFLVGRFFSIRRTFKGSSEEAQYDMSELYRGFLQYNKNNKIENKMFSFGQLHGSNSLRWVSGLCKKRTFMCSEYIQVSGKGYLYTKGLKTLINNSIFKNTGFIESFDFIKERSKKETSYAFCYLLQAKEHPFFEQLSKCGFTKIINHISWDFGYWYFTDPKDSFNTEAKSIIDFLKIDKVSYKRILGKNPTANQLFLLRTFPKLTDQELDFYQNVSNRSCLKTIFELTTPHKAMRYLTEVVKSKNLSDSVSLYADYLKMAKKEHYNFEEKELYYYDMKNTMKLFPKHLKDAHDKEVELTKLASNEIARRKREEFIQKLQSQLPAIHKKYDYTGKDFIITAPNSGHEIEREGDILHICVGTAGYIEDMAEGKTTILFLRKVAHPKKPFFCVEVKNNEVVQLRGFSNCDAPKEVENFVNEFKQQKLFAA